MCESAIDMTSIPVIEINEEKLKGKLSHEIEENSLNKIIQEDTPEVLNKSDCKKSVSNEVLEQLASGILSLHVGNLKSMSSSLSELTRNQDIVFETLQQENLRFAEALTLLNLDELFNKTKIYHSKLHQIKKEMTTVHERSAKLKRRALRLQQQKQKEALLKEQRKDRELERDKQLAPVLATK